MAETTIEWADYTFNPWMGCTKVSPACANCYAERDMDHRYGKVAWGPKGTRRKTTIANWRKLLKWNRDAARIRAEHSEYIAELDMPAPPAYPHRPRVFCASLADVFEDWKGPIQDHKGQRLQHCDGVFQPDGIPEFADWPLATMDDLRADLFRLIDATPHLDWLLLTKRPENILSMWPGNKSRENVWLGTSVENQEYALKRIPALLQCRHFSPVLFLSCEPLVGPLNLVQSWSNDRTFYDYLGGVSGFVTENGGHRTVTGKPSVDWVITGGESGPNARPAHPDWYRGIRDQCFAADVPFLFKQWGEWLHMSQFVPGTHDLRGKTIDGSPHDFNARIGKKAAGRLLDGVEYNGFPKVAK